MKHMARNGVFVLALLEKNGPSYGYAINTYMARVADVEPMSPSSLYETIGLLRRNSYITVDRTESDGRGRDRIVYAITELGSGVLHEEIGAYARVLDWMDDEDVCGMPEGDAYDMIEGDADNFGHALIEGALDVVAVR